MSDNIPFEFQAAIMKRLPVKSLIQFRSVSKPWKSLIDSADFINHYSGHHTQVQQLVVRYEDPVNYEHKYVSIVDDDTFPQQKVSLTVPLSITKLIYSTMIGSSHGLLCLYKSGSFNGRRNDAVVLWNISVRKGIAVVVPNVEEGIYGTTIGFGVCRETNDTKIVKINYVDPNMKPNMESVTSIPYQVEVFTLSTKTWRSPRGNLPRKSIHFHPFDEVVLDGVVYWVATDRFTVDGFRAHCLIVSFDVTSEEFREITLPGSLAHQPDLIESLFKLNESLVVVEADESSMSDYVVWMMGDGFPESFIKLFTFTPNEDVLLVGFRKSGEPIIEIPEERGDDQGDDRGQLAVYERQSKHIVNLGIDGLGDSFSVQSYVETLLLLDQPDFMVYNGILRV